MLGFSKWIHWWMSDETFDQICVKFGRHPFHAPVESSSKDYCDKDRNKSSVAEPRRHRSSRIKRWQTINRNKCSPLLYYIRCYNSPSSSFSCGCELDEICSLKEPKYCLKSAFLYPTFKSQPACKFFHRLLFNNVCCSCFLIRHGPYALTIETMSLIGCWPFSDEIVCSADEFTPLRNETRPSTRK